MSEVIAKTEAEIVVLNAAMASLVQTMKAITSLPDNSEINRLPGSAKGFTMSLSSLDSGLTLSAFTYDFASQYDALVELLSETLKNKTARKRLDNIVNGNGVDPKHGRFHEKVIRMVKEGVNEYLAKFA